MFQLQGAIGSTPKYNTLRVEQKHNGKVTWITMNRPEVHNAFNQELIEELTTVFNKLETSDTRAVVIAGEGKSFSAGADLNYMKSMATFSAKQNENGTPAATAA